MFNVHIIFKTLCYSIPHDNKPKFSDFPTRLCQFYLLNLNTAKISFDIYIRRTFYWFFFGMVVVNIIWPVDNKIIIK